MDFLYQLLQGAVESGASDIHLKGESPIFFRISGQLHPVEGEVLPCTTCDAIVNFLIPAHLKTQFRDSREVDFSFQVPNIGRFRANIFYQRGDLSLAIRNVKTKVPSFSDLHLPESFGPLALSPNGIILVCGSTGSGKSSTLAAIIDHINRSHRLHIITLEDPIEYVFTDDQSVINQREIGLDTASFKNGLVQIMRQDPDVIMIGEMRDSASISAAMSAAETGHLVLSTLHSSSAPQAVTRILDFFPPESREQARKQMALCLRAIICQILVPAASGAGVFPAHEIMLNNSTVRKMLEENKLDRLGAAVETGREEGMITFNQSLLALCKSGKITEPVALDFAPNPESLKMNLKGIFLSDDNRILG